MKGLKEIGCHTQHNGRNSFGPLIRLFFLFGLLGGAYLAVIAVANPMRASDLEVLGGGFAVALSSFLLFYFVRPQSKEREMLRSKKNLAQLEMDEQFEHSPEVIAAD